MASVTPQEKAGISPATQHLNARHECARVVFEVAFVDAQEEDAVVGRDECDRAAHEDEIVIVAARPTGALIAVVSNGNTVRACALVGAQVDFTGGGDHNSLSALNPDFGA